MTDLVIYDLLVILTTGLLAGVMCQWLRVPVLIGYMLVGVLISAGGLGLVQAQSHEVEQLAEAGVFLLLFAIGLEFSLDELWHLARHLVVGGSLQMALVIVPVTGALVATGLSWQSAMLLSAAVAFSSTVLVFKSLAEWGQSATPAGRRAVGILLFQDVALVPLLLVLPLLTGGETTTRDYVVLAAVSLAFVISVVVLRWLLGRWFIPQLVRYRSPELVVLAAVVVLGSVTFATHLIGLPPALGAFAAGLMLSGHRWSAQIDALVMPFRETFAVVFFVSLGLLLDPRVVIGDPFRIAVLLVALVAVKAVAAIVALRSTGLAWRSAAAMGGGLAHVGEFAFVLVAVAGRADLLSPENMQRFVAVAISSLLLAPVLLRLGLQRTVMDVSTGDNQPPRPLESTISPTYAIVVGIGPIGGRIASHLETTGHEVCVIDRSPLNIQPFEQQGFHGVVGDATDVTTLMRAQLQRATLVVVCVPHDPDGIEIVRLVRHRNPECKVVVRCRYRSTEATLRKSGAAHVVSEEWQSGEALLRAL